MTSYPNVTDRSLVTLGRLTEKQKIQRAEKF